MTDSQPPRPGYQQQTPQPHYPQQVPHPSHPQQGRPLADQQGGQYRAGQQQGPLPSVYGNPASASADGPRANPLGLASLIVGALNPLLGLLSTLVVNLLIVAGNGTQGITFASAGFAVLSGLLGLAALVLGIIALLRKNSRKAAAGAGTALGAAGIVGLLGNLLVPLIFSLA